MAAAFCSFWLLLGHQCSFSEILEPLSSVICVVDQLCHSETIFSELFEYIPSYIFFCSILITHLFDRLTSFTLQNRRVFVVCIYFFFKFDVWVFWSTGMIVELSKIVLPNFQYLSLMYYCILLQVFYASVLNPLFFST
jgi:hypothetical protein